MVQFKQNINTNREEKSMKNIFSDSKERFSIRKYTIGVASVLLSTLVFVEGNVYADEVKNNTDSQTSVVAQENQGERHKESGLEANEAVTQANTSVTPSESASPTSQASAENSANVIKDEKTERQSNEAVAPARTSATPAESTSPTSQASAEAPAHVVKEENNQMKLQHQLALVLHQLSQLLQLQKPVPKPLHLQLARKKLRRNLQLDQDVLKENCLHQVVQQPM